MIAFNKFYNQFNILSITLVVISLCFLIFKGLNFGIDFKGGTLIELRSSNNKINVSSLRDNLSQMDLGDVSVKKFGNNQDYLVKFENQNNKKNIENKANRVVTDVIKVLDKVSLIEIFVNSKILISEYLFKFSLTLSKITTVSFIE